MPKYYFVVYEIKTKASQLRGPEQGVIANVILKDIHPVIWVSTPQFEYQKYFVMYLHWWKEISKDVAMEAERLNCVNIERLDSDNEDNQS